MSLEFALQLVRGPRHRFRQIDGLQVQLQAAGLDTHHVEHVADEAIEPLALVFDVGQQRGVAALLRFLELMGCGDDRSERSAEVMADRREKRSPQAVAFAKLGDRAHLLRQRHSFKRERRLIDEAHQEWQPIRSHRLAAILSCNAEDAERFASGKQWLEQPFRRGERVRASAGRFLMLKAPFRRGAVDRSEDTLRRDSGSQFQLSDLVGKHQDRIDVELSGNFTAKRLPEFLTRA